MRGKPCLVTLESQAPASQMGLQAWHHAACSASLAQLGVKVSMHATAWRSGSGNIASRQLRKQWEVSIASRQLWNNGNLIQPTSQLCENMGHVLIAATKAVCCTLLVHARLRCRTCISA